MSTTDTQTQTETNRLDPTSQQYQRDVMSRAREVSGKGFEGYGGERVAGMDPMFMQGIQQLMGPGSTGDYRDMYNLGFGGAQAGMGGMQDILGRTGLEGIEGFYNPYEDRVIDDAFSNMDRAQQMARMNVGGSATSMGAFGGARHGIAEGTAASEIARGGMQDINALRQAGFTDAADRMMNERLMGLQGYGAMTQMGTNLGFGGLQGIEGLRTQSANAAMMGGDYARNIDQQRKDAQYEEFMREQQHPYLQLQAMQGAGAAMLPYAGTDSTKQLEMKRSIVPQLIGAATTIGGAYLGKPPMPGGGPGGGGGPSPWMDGGNPYNVPMPPPPQGPMGGWPQPTPGMPGYPQSPSMSNWFGGGWPQYQQQPQWPGG